MTDTGHRTAGMVARAHARRKSRQRRRLYPLVAAGVVMVMILTPLIGAARTPGNEAYTAKLADWLRSHHASALVTPIESWYYQHQAPGKGGRPKALNPLPNAQPKATAAATPVGPAHLPRPGNIGLVASPPLPGEGQWQPVGPQVAGQQGMYEAQFRADTTYTGQITTAVWIDPTVLRLSLVPGAREPGGTWAEPPDLSGPAADAAVAAFNGGFRLSDAHGGFFLDGREAVPLQPGAESVVIDDSGRAEMGTWDVEVRMHPGVHAVLQNLVPIVDHGQTAPSATYQDSKIWGQTIGLNAVVARSGLGITANGAVVYVAGPALTALTLAESLQRAGAVRAMTLDINPEWVTWNFFTHTGATLVPTKLYPQMSRPANRYLGPTHESRDFFAVSVPPLGA